MASATLLRHGFADGTSVSAWPSQNSVNGDAPSGVAVATATVTSGALTFTGLTEGAKYIAYALGRGVLFRVDQTVEDPPAGDRERIADMAAVLVGAGGSSQILADRARLTSVEGSTTLLAEVNALIGGTPATGDGVADDTAALQAKADSAGATRILQIPPRTYRITNTITFTGPVDARGAIFSYEGTDDKQAIVLDGIAGAVLGANGTEIYLPEVVNTNKVGLGWAGTAIGVEVRRVRDCVIHVPRVRNFAVGLKEVGGLSAATSAGEGYNTFVIGGLSNNQVNHLIYPATADSWVNQNTYVGPQHYSHDSVETRSGTRHIELINRTPFQPNNHTWVNPSLEGLVAEYVVKGDCSTCKWINARVEGGGTFGFHKIKFDGIADAARPAQENRFEAGFESRNLKVEPGTTPGTTEKLNVVNSIDGERRSGNPSWMGANIASANAPVFVAMSTADLSEASDLGIPAMTTEGSLGKFAASIGAIWTRFKVSGDIHSRILIDYLNRRINFGPGNGAVDVLIERKNVGVLGLGTSHSFRTGLAATGSRPTPGAAGQGSQFYDTTLNKPIWSDGTNWRDAAGTIV